MKKFLLLTGVFFHLSASIAQNAPLNRYAGIEIGVTGVKFTIIDLNSELEKVDNLNYFAYNKIAEEMDNTRSGFIIEFTSGVSQQTMLAVEKFYNKAKNVHHLPELQIFICVSYGVVSQAMKKDNVSNSDDCSTLMDLKKRILQRIPTYDKARNGYIGFLREHEESELTHLGVIPKEIQTNVALVDIGSGSTKGGYFTSEPNPKFVSFEIVEGTRSLSNRAKNGILPEDFDRLYRSKVQDIVNNQLASEIRSSVNDIRTKSDIILTGGICWAVARITNVEHNKDMQRITIEDVNQVIRTVSDNDFFKSLQAKSKLPENEELKRVLDVFNQDLLISGSILLKKMMEEIQRNQNNYRFYVYKANYMSWLKGYIMKSKVDSNTTPKTTLPATTAPVNRYAGIEIGSSGVKFTVIDLTQKRDKTDNLSYYVYNKIEEDSDNTNFIDFTQATTKSTVEAVERFYKKATSEYGISDFSIYICISHGVVSQSMKKDNVTNRNECETLTDLKKRVWEKIPVYTRKRSGCIGFLDEHEESELTHLGVIPKEIQANVALVDIGSGNTKGGYFSFEPVKRFIPFEIEEGTRSLSNRAKKDILPVDFDRLYRSKVQEIVNNQLANEIRSSASDIRTKFDIILTGGICWAVARITNVEENKDMQRITIEDVNQVIRTVSDNDSFKSLQAKSKLPENKELKRVLGVFNQELLISGSILLKKMVEAIQRDSADYHFYVYKASYVGWLKGYIISSISEKDTGYKSICRD